MKVFNSVVSMSTLVLAIGASFAVNDAQAVTQSRSFYSNAPGLCQAALPAFEGLIRKRPLSVQNEGSGAAFVTCAFTAQTSPTGVVIWFHSVDGASHPVSCTGVTGWATGSNQFVVKSGTVPATGQGSLTWLGADFAGAPATIPGSGRFSVSCSIEAGVGIDDTQVVFSEDVGA